MAQTKKIDYTPNTCRATGKVITAYAPGSARIYFAEVDESGHATGQTKAVQLDGRFRASGRADGFLTDLFAPELGSN